MAKLIGVVFSIAAGLIAGKEGPFVHGGGIVGGGIGSMGSQYVSLSLSSLAIVCGRHLQQGRHWCRERCSRSVCGSMPTPLQLLCREQRQECWLDLQSHFDHCSRLLQDTDIYAGGPATL